uniref:Uncharacterized protein n=1 Tax=Cyclopterus lumpus TaxID=8103 RepID=A0A8C2WJW5_CYCLU
PIHRHIYLPDIRNRCVSPVIIPLSLGDNILAGALEVKVVTIKCVVMGVTPGPAYACVLGDADSVTLHNTALLFDPTLGIFAGIYTRKTRKGTFIGNPTLTLKSYNLFISVYGMAFFAALKCTLYVLPLS